MPTWNKILEETNRIKATGNARFDRVRRRYLVKLHKHTHRAVILYATAWTQSGRESRAPADTATIGPEDLQGFMQTVNQVGIRNLDLILHSPGGSPFAAEAIVRYLREQFDHIRVIVPTMAMSAATMIACAADEIVLGKHSYLGPIDPQMTLPTPLGTRTAPAQAILDQFQMAQMACRENPANLAVWAPLLQQFGPDLLVQCINALELSKQLVNEWLKRYMFSDDADKVEKSRAISEWLASHTHFRSHSRGIARSELEANGLKIVHLEDDEELQDAVLSAFHATTLTFDGASAVKIIENHLGKAFIKTFRRVVIAENQ